MNEQIPVAVGETRRGRDLLGLPVYSIAEGNYLGMIDILYVRRQDSIVPWVRIGGGTLKGHAYLPFTAFQTLGIDIALVPENKLLHARLPEEEASSLDTSLPDRAVLTHDGEHVGHLKGFEVDTENGAIVGFHVRPDGSFLHHVVAKVRDETVFLPVGAVSSLGPDAVILSPEALPLFRQSGDMSEETAGTPVAGETHQAVSGREN